ncbi:MAG TPA: APC family permease [Rickettsiales bacterium]|nr:APC family permease [Rickettsiales bacterium]
MDSINKLKHLLLGPPRDPFSKHTHHSIALIAFLAWIGLGADGLSSSCYGPEEAFLALGEHTSLGIYLAMATALTVFIISLAYTQVIELFPNGGGGYRVASSLVGAHAGLVSGAALIVDYILTIAISVASGVDALFSLLPEHMLHIKLTVECLMIVLLVLLNLRGVKESIKVLMPIFLGFVITHAFLIIYGISMHAVGLPTLVPAAIHESQSMAQAMGAVFVASLFLKAFSLGGGTYTGLEAVSNYVNTLAEPRLKTGKMTMLFIALSLAFTAGGIIILYLLWGAKPEVGQTLNAVAFRSIMQGWHIGDKNIAPGLLIIVLSLEAGLLLVAANTGFLAGPAVLANMAVDKWMPHFFSSLSSRLVTKNGIILMGGSSLLVLLLTDGDVSVLVVLYSINVFLTFSLSLLGLCKHWIKNRKEQKRWIGKFISSFTGLIVCGGILIVTTVEKFFAGGWLTLLITSGVIGLGLLIRKSYDRVGQKLALADELFADMGQKAVSSPPPLDPTQQTAVFIVNDCLGSGMHALLWVLRLFPGIYKNFVFVSVGEVDSGNLAESDHWRKRQADFKETLQHYVNYCHSRGHAATYYMAFGTDVVQKLSELTEKIIEDFPKVVFFSSKLIFDDDNFFTQFLYNQNAYIMQRRLHNLGNNMIILPMRV